MIRYIEGMDVKQVTERKYVKLAGVLGGIRIRHDLRGSSWFMPGIGLVTEMVTPDGYKYLVVKSF